MKKYLQDILSTTTPLGAVRGFVCGTTHSAFFCPDIINNIINSKNNYANEKRRTET